MKPVQALLSAAFENSNLSYTVDIVDYDAIKNIELITEAEDWLDMLGKRSLSSYTYDEDTAKEIYQNISQKYISLLTDFRDEMQSKLKK